MIEYSSPRVRTGLDGSAPDSAFRLTHGNWDLKLIVALAAVDLLWLRLSAVSASGWLQPTAAVGLLGAIAITYSRYRPAPALAEMAVFGAKWIGFTVFAVVLTYLGASLQLPLMDSAFARWDRAIGFDWPAWVDKIGTAPSAKWVLAAAYASLLPQIALSIILLSIRRDSRRNEGLLLGATISLLITTFVSTLLPAMGPWVHYDHGVSNPAQVVYVRDVLALRSGDAASFTIQGMQGILCFPSYHTILAVLITFAHRRSRYFAVFAAVNALMLLSIPSEGGHYLVDMVAGIVVAFATLAIVRRMQNGTR